MLKIGENRIVSALFLTSFYALKILHVLMGVVFLLSLTFAVIESCHSIYMSIFPGEAGMKLPSEQATIKLIFNIIHNVIITLIVFAIYLATLAFHNKVNIFINNNSESESQEDKNLITGLYGQLENIDKLFYSSVITFCIIDAISQAMNIKVGNDEINIIYWGVRPTLSLVIAIICGFLLHSKQA